MKTYKMHSKGIGIGTLVLDTYRLLDPVGCLVHLVTTCSELFVNSPTFGDRRGPNTRLYNWRKNPGYKRYINNHTLVCHLNKRENIWI